MYAIDKALPSLKFEADNPGLDITFGTNTLNNNNFDRIYKPVEKYHCELFLLLDTENKKEQSLEARLVRVMGFLLWENATEL